MLIDLKTLQAVNVAALKEATRFYLQGVYVAPAPYGAIDMVATDGHMLIAARVERREDDNSAPVSAPVIIPSALIERIKPLRGSTICSLTVAASPSGAASITIDYAGAVYSEAAIDGTFPDWQRVLPMTAPSGEGAMISASITGRFAKAMKLARGDKDPSPVPYMNGAADAFYMGLGEIESAKWFGVAMPMRCKESDLAKLPIAWAGPRAAAALQDARDKAANAKKAA